MVKNDWLSILYNKETDGYRSAQARPVIQKINNKLQTKRNNLKILINAIRVIISVKCLKFLKLFILALYHLGSVTFQSVFIPL